MMIKHVDRPVRLDLISIPIVGKTTQRNCDVKKKSRRIRYGNLGQTL